VGLQTTEIPVNVQRRKCLSLRLQKFHNRSLRICGTRRKEWTSYTPKRREIKIKIKVKVKLFLCFNLAPHHEGVLGNGGIVLRILDLGTRQRSVVSFTPRPLYLQRKNPWYPLDRRLSGPQSRSGRGGEEKNSQPPPEIEP
jgi:hypothetical protein